MQTCTRFSDSWPCESRPFGQSIATEHRAIRISCWNPKYTYNVVRPLSYIQSVIDSNWNRSVVTDPVITPPFPEYRSGHSVQSGAVATVLAAIFGNPFQFTDNSYRQRGLPARTYGCFREAVQEAAISRLYAGIHYLPSIEIGLIQGECIGSKINQLKFRKSAADT
jgi:membrane-associated phospholipid phosphatase